MKFGVSNFPLPSPQFTYLWKLWTAWSLKWLPTVWVLGVFSGWVTRGKVSRLPNQSLSRELQFTKQENQGEIAKMRRDRPFFRNNNLIRSHCLGGDVTKTLIWSFGEWRATGCRQFTTWDASLRQRWIMQGGVNGLMFHNTWPNS